MDSNFTTEFSVAEAPEQVFDAVTNLRGWWSEAIAGSTAVLGQEFTYRVPAMHYCTMRTVELVPARKVTWLVTDNYFSFTQDTSEWLGTEVGFELSRHDGGTRVQFRHRGLAPEYECYDVCTNAWTTYVNGSLRSLITTGAGQPNSMEGAAAITAVRAGAVN